jgi:hypothetical protein
MINLDSSNVKIQKIFGNYLELIANQSKQGKIILNKIIEID